MIGADTFNSPVLEGFLEYTVELLYVENHLFCETLQPANHFLRLFIYEMLHSDSLAGVLDTLCAKQI